MRAYSWSSSGRSFPWLAILLLVLGVGLLIELLFPDLSFGSLLILATGLAFGAAWLLGRIVGATVPALVLTAWGLAGVASDLELISGDGWGSLFIGIAFLIGWGNECNQRLFPETLPEEYPWLRSSFGCKTEKSRRPKILKILMARVFYA